MVKFDYTKDDIRRIAKEENVRFLRLMFTDLYVQSHQWMNHQTSSYYLKLYLTD